MIDLWAVQQAIYSALTTAPTTYAVYDAVPQGVNYPYIVIGEITATPDDEITDASADASFTIHGWSKGIGKKEAHALLQFIRDRLDNQPISGAWAISEESADVFEDRTSTAASRLYHAFARYRVRTD